MNKSAKVLAATDLSAPSRHAVDRALIVAGDAKTDLTLIHVLSESMLDELMTMLGKDAGPVAAQVRQNAQKSLQDLANKSTRGIGTAVGTHLTVGSILASIVKHAEEIDAGLLVVGARGENFLRHILLGSTSSRLLRKSVRPVLVVKQAPHVSYRNVLVPVDLTAASVEAIELARWIAPQARLILLHAFELPFEGKLTFAGVEEEIIRKYRAAEHAKAMDALRELSSKCALDPKQTTLLVRPGNPPRQIIEQEQVQDCDLIVMGKHNERSIEDLLLGNVTKHVLSESQGDILIFTAH